MLSYLISLTLSSQSMQSRGSGLLHSSVNLLHLIRGRHGVWTAAIKFSHKIQFGWKATFKLLHQYGHSCKISHVPVESVCTVSSDFVFNIVVDYYSIMWCLGWRVSRCMADISHLFWICQLRTFQGVLSHEFVTSCMAIDGFRSRDIWV